MTFQQPTAYDPGTDVPLLRNGACDDSRDDARHYHVADSVFFAEAGLECITKEKITAFHGVPTMFIAMLEHPDFDNTDFSHVRTASWRKSVPIKVMRDVIEKMNMTEICITYGQTEASRVVR